MVPYEYFMDRMQQYELQMLVDMTPWAFKHNDEQARLILWGVLSPYMKIKKSPQDLVPLVTDKDAAHEEMLDDASANKIRNEILKQWGKN